MDWSILISTFERPEVLKKSLEFTRKNWPDIPITVGDQSREYAFDI